jgi:hypothetical protein
MSIEGLKISQGRAITERLQAAFKENVATYVAHNRRTARV